MSTAVDPRPEAPKQRPADLRLVPAALSAWAVAAWAGGAAPGTALFAGVLLCAVGSLLALAMAVRPPAAPEHGLSPRWGTSVATVAAVMALAAGLTSSVASGHLALREAGPMRALAEAGATATVRLVVTSDPRPVAASRFGQQDRVAVRARVEEVRARGRNDPVRSPVLVLGGRDWHDVSPGQRMTATGRLSRAEAGDDVVALLVAWEPPTDRQPAAAAHRVTARLRAGLAEASAGLSPDSRGLLPGLVVGDTSRLPLDLERDMRTTGLTHLTAVSGSNVAIVCGAVLLLAAWAGAGTRMRVVLAAAALAGFVLLARPDPSVLRAAVMGVAALVGIAAARQGRGMPTLSLTVVLLVCVDPWLARSYGFVLSVTATTGLLLLARPWAHSLSRWVPSPVAHALAVPAAAQAACGPVLILLDPRLSVLAVPANALTGPAVVPATVLGVVVTVLAPLWPAGAAGVAWLAGLATAWIAWVARTGAASPAASLAWPEGGHGAMLLAGATLVVVLALALLARAGRRRVRVAGWPDPPAGSTAPARPAVLAGASTGVVAVVAAVVIAGVAGVGLHRRAAWPPPGWRVVACDVGQGDAMVIRTGDHRAVVVDAGPDASAADDCLRRLGVDVIDLLVLTHFHADHVEGLPGLLRGRAVAGALVSPLPDPEAQARRVAAALDQVDVASAPAAAGMHGTAGDVVWKVLWPLPASSSSTPPSEPNDSSVVLQVQAPGMTLVAAGDIEPEAQRQLARVVASAPEPPAVDVLKVAHHGSAHQEPALHRLWSPRVAIVSSGAGNTYGHPAPATLDMLREVGAVVLRTDTGGDVAVTVTDGRLRTVTRRGRRPRASARDRPIRSAAGTSLDMAAA